MFQIYSLQVKLEVLGKPLDGVVVTTAFCPCDKKNLLWRSELLVGDVETLMSLNENCLTGSVAPFRYSEKVILPNLALAPARLESSLCCHKARIDVRGFLAAL